VVEQLEFAEVLGGILLRLTSNSAKSRFASLAAPHLIKSKVAYVVWKEKTKYDKGNEREIGSNIFLNDFGG
jgi:hypothetical protein